MPIMCDGNNAVNGNPKPVALVRIVVRRNSAVQPGSRLEPSSPNRTKMPATIPIRLMMTWRMVKVGRLRPSIMTRSPVKTRRMLRLPAANDHMGRGPPRPFGFGGGPNAGNGRLQAVDEGDIT